MKSAQHFRPVSISKQINPMNFRKILFLAEGQLGDLLLLTPALRAVKESDPASSVSVLVLERRNSEVKQNPFDDLTATPAARERSVLSTNPNVDDLYVLNREALRSLHGIARQRAEWKIIKFLRRQKFDAVVCTFPEDRFVEWAFASGARTRVGQRKQNLHWLLTRKPDIEKAEKGVIEYYCDLARAIGVDVRSATTEYIIPLSSTEWANRLLTTANISPTQEIIGIHPGATGNYKIWPPGHYAALINHLSKKTIVLLLGSKLDQPVISAIKKDLDSPVIEIQTSESVGNLAAMLHRCRLCISNDSGPRHLAIAVGTPSLAFFRQHHDREWGVYEANERVTTLKGSRTCPACPPDVCMDRIPAGEKFSSYCVRMIDIEDAIRRAADVLRRTG